MTVEPTLDCARHLDAGDPLAPLRARFELPTGPDGSPRTYLCGHSLGLAPRAARLLVEEELEDWARLGVLGHAAARRPWVDYHLRLAPGLAALAGAEAHEVVAMNSLTVNLHLMLASFYRPAGTRRRILIEAGAFPSDRHAVASQIAWHGLDPAGTLIELAPRSGEDLVSEADLETLLAHEGDSVALVLWPAVQFRTGQRFDLARITQAARRCGAAAGFDLAHAIGNVPLALHDAGADFGVWCSYKYLNAGPGAIGGAFVHECHGGGTLPRLAGWWGHEAATRFAMSPQFRPEPGAAGWAVSNPPILAAAPLLASLTLFGEARLERLREKSLALTGFLQLLLERLVPPRALRIITPRKPEERGCQLSLRLGGPPGRARRVFERLLAQGCICDWREPDILRVAPAPFYNGFVEVYAFVERLIAALRAEGAGP